MLKLVGYSDRLSVAPGETISFMVSADGLPEYRASIVRLIHGDANPDGPGFKSRPVETEVEGAYPGRKQVTRSGSYVEVPDHTVLRDMGSFTLAAHVWPTMPGTGAQTLIAKGDVSSGPGFALALDERGGLVFRVRDVAGETASVAVDKPMLSHHWYRVVASFDETSGRMHVAQTPLQQFPQTDDAGHATATVPFGRLVVDAPLTMAATLDAAGPLHCFNGKIEAPCVACGALDGAAAKALFEPSRELEVFAAWDFARNTPSTRIVDIGPHGLHGECKNLPARAMKGHAWTGEVHDWRQRPDHYGAIHFHDDDLYDAGWEADFAWTVPAGMKSGVYCAHIRSYDGAHEDYLPFAVRPPRGQATADCAVLLPTASYMAYANDHMGVDSEDAELVMGRLIVVQPNDLYVDEHREFGLALYDTHSDGSGVCYSSRLRPVLNMRPKFSSWVGGAGSGLWQFNADTHLFDWLEEKGFTYDVITDEDLHAEGAELLKPYKTILSGTHPEYHSTPMRDAMETYLGSGGRLMYLGGNGWYWRIAFHQDLPGVIEVRRAEDGIRTWVAEPGEYYHSFTGEYGGIWRRVGKPPNELLATGFTAQGFDVSSYYVRKPDSFDPRAAFIFEGVGDDERIGDFGLVGGGAAGLELDRADPLIGTPPNTLVLASSQDHTDLYLVVCEEIAVMAPGLHGQHPLVRADMTFHERPGGGAVFSTSSIAWCGSLSHNNYDNNVSRIMENVLRRFLEPEPFDGLA